MKKMMMALAALCVAGVAGAVTLNWEQLSADADNANKYSLSTAISANGNDDTFTKGAIKVSFVYSKEVTGEWPGYLFSLSGNGNANGVGCYFNNSNVKVETKGLSHSGNDWSSWSQTLTKGERYEFVLAVERWNEVADKLSADLYLNGVKVATVESQTTGGSWLQSVYVGQEGEGGSTLDTDVLSDVDVSYIGNISRAEVAAALPEPTALALLALGVAGLALRRKAA